MVVMTIIILCRVMNSVFIGSENEKWLGLSFFHVFASLFAHERSQTGSIFVCIKTKQWLLGLWCEICDIEQTGSFLSMLIF